MMIVLQNKLVPSSPEVLLKCRIFYLNRLIGNQFLVENLSVKYLLNNHYAVIIPIRGKVYFF